ncbi:MAG: hypothetical protein EBU66_05535 [Bacteroidetes bacterium]|nr:hypothetical protein [bacterium]NBP64124.1 hypothetical protein [Bacteroidota bacterium]
MVHTREWGPHLWRMLHICAERCGKQPTQMLHMDEVSAFANVLKLVEAILPCPLCQKHYREWRMKHPLKRIMDKRNPTEFHESVKFWLWNLHDTINADRGVDRIPIVDALAPYTEMNTKHFQEAFDNLLEVLDRAKLQRLIDGIHLREWLAKLALLRRMLKV